MPRGSRTGCITCRIRKVKCDEVKPACQRCLSTGRRCDGYSALPFSRNELRYGGTAVLTTDPAFSDVHEKRLFQYFRQNTVPGTNCLIDSSFWNRIVLQASHSQPSIKHAVLALSSWHRNLSTLGQQELSGNRGSLHADQQYQLALEHAQKLIKSASTTDIDQILVASIIFSIYEAVRGYHTTSQQHLTNCRRILRQYSNVLTSSRRTETSEILHTLTRIDIAFADQNLEDSALAVDVDLDDLPESAQFNSFREAQRSLFDIGRRVILLQRRTCEAHIAGDLAVYERYQSERRKCLPVLAKWKDSFDQRDIRTASKDDSLAAVYLSITYQMSIIFSQAEDAGPETQYDAFLPQFESIVACGEQIVRHLMNEAQQNLVSYDNGYVNCMFFAACRCRHPGLRRRAIAVLNAMPRQEGIWNSTSAAKVAAEQMRLEEIGLEDNVISAEDVPEQKRLWQLEGDLKPGETSVTAQFSGFPPGSCTFRISSR